MTAQTIAISAIDASDRLQPVDALKVEAIAAAIEEKGLIQPIVVRPEGDGYKLTAGGHRLAALILLGWAELIVGLHVIIREEDSSDDARLTEVYENIFRSPPTALGMAIHLRTAQRIYDDRRGETRGRKAKVEKLQEDKKVLESRIISSERFTKDAAKRINLAPSVISDYCRVAKALDQETIAEIRGTMIEDNFNELKQLVEVPAEKRLEAAAAIKRGEAKTVREARVAIASRAPTHVLVVSDGHPDNPAAALAAADLLSARIDVVYCGPDGDLRGMSFMRRLARGGGQARHHDMTREPQRLADAVQSLALLSAPR